MLVRVWYFRPRRWLPNERGEMPAGVYDDDERRDVADVSVPKATDSALAKAVTDATGDTVLRVDEWHEHAATKEYVDRRTRKFALCECGFNYGEVVGEVVKGGG